MTRNGEREKILKDGKEREEKAVLQWFNYMMELSS